MRVGMKVLAAGLAVVTAVTALAPVKAEAGWRERGGYYGGGGYVEAYRPAPRHYHRDRSGDAVGAAIALGAIGVIAGLALADRAERRRARAYEYENYPVYSYRPQRVERYYQRYEPAPRFYNPGPRYYYRDAGQWGHDWR
jgi:hypothetical protein